MTRHRWAVAASLAAAGAAVAVALAQTPPDGPGPVAVSGTMFNYGFETPEPAWVPGAADARHAVKAHRITNDSFKSGQRAEFIHLHAEPGSFIHYTFDVGNAPVSDDLILRLQVRANRAGMRVLARAVLPRERDPRDPRQPATVILAGQTYQTVGRWQPISLVDPMKRLREQQSMLQAEVKGRAVDVSGAYIDRVILNVYGGPGDTQVWTDDLEIGPVPAAPPADPLRPAPARPANRRPADVALRGNQLVVDGERVFLRGVRHVGTPLPVLRQAGFNAVWLDEATPTNLIEDAAKLDFLMVPVVSLPPPDTSGGVPGTLTSSGNALGKTMARFLERDRVLCWDLGSNLTEDQLPVVKRNARAFRAADPSRPLAADVWDGYRSYTRGVDGLMLGIHRWPLMTTLEPVGYRDWLTQRRRLAAPGDYTWTWVQAHTPEWAARAAYDRPSVEGLHEPSGPQHEQVRLLAYTAVGSGCRGLGFWADRSLADHGTGRDRLLGMALLNLELEMLEPLLVTGQEPRWIDTSVPDVKAAVIRTDKAVVVLPVWMGAGSQFVPAQAAVPELRLTVPLVPDSWQPWEVSPGGVRAAKWDRSPPGARVTLNEFDLTGCVIFTGDLSPTGLVVKLQERQQAKAQLAAQWAHDLAVEELGKVEHVNAELAALGVAEKDAATLLARAKASVDRSLRLRRNGDHAEGYLEAQRALRPLRVLMRASWERAARELETPVASPYAVSYYTLPRHWRFAEAVRQARWQPNALAGGGFEVPPDQKPQGWVMPEYPSLDKVTATAVRDAADPHEGKQCLKLEIVPEEKEFAPVVLERTFLAIHSPEVQLPPGTLVRVSAWVKVPQPLTGTADGALFYDSAGGEPLGVRLTWATKWKRLTLFRKVPESGRVSVTLALTGLGAAYFDDVRIEPVAGAAAAPGGTSATTRLP